MDLVALALAAEGRFWSKVRKGEGDDCWEWTDDLSTTGGYGVISLGGRKGRMYRAHRIAWIIATGTDPGQDDVLHTCDNPPCVRFSHLFLGDAQMNSADMMQKGRGTPHNLLHQGESHHNAKMTQALADEARAKYTTGLYKQRDLAAEYGIRQSTLQNILNNKTWRTGT